MHELCHQLHVRLAFDVVGGDITRRLLRAMPHRGHVIVLGALSKQDCPIHPNLFIFERKRVDGFWLAEWFPKQNRIYQFRAALQIQVVIVAWRQQSTRVGGS